MALNEYIDSIKNKSIAVLGIGVSNVPLLELLLKAGCDVIACDRREREQIDELYERLSSMGAELHLGESYLEDINRDIIFRTPGIMPFEDHIMQAVNNGSVLTSEMELFMKLCPCKIIAVTGSDGKTTTSTIISELLKESGYTVHLGGNIGHPLLAELPSIKPEDIVVLELSSFQLHSMKCSPDIALITNVSPNHLDKHKDFEDYVQAKRLIFKNQSPSAKLILNFDDPHSQEYAKQAESRIVYFSDKAALHDGLILKEGQILRLKEGHCETIMNATDIRIPGEHNLLNYLAAFAATDGLVPNDVCRRVAKSFGGVEHRLEFVRSLRGVSFINDSIGSSPSRTSAGLRAMRQKPIVIAGGYDKHIPFDDLGDDLCRLAKKVFLTGDTASKIADAVTTSRFYSPDAVELCLIEDFKQTVEAAAASAESGDIVLFSPACASFDRFKNFAERGNYFKSIVMELK